MIQKTLHLSKIILANDKEAIIGGGLLIEDSKIISVGKKEDFGDLTSKNFQIIDHGETLICPGFINLHTHLLYSKLNLIDGSDGLFPWLKELIDSTLNWREKDFIASINYGINQALSSGTTYIVENTPNLLSVQELAKGPIKALIGLEVFGSNEEEAEKTFQEALDFNSKFSILNSQLNFTFSPHAPYDVSKPLWEKLTHWSTGNNKPLLTHLEESPQEKLWWQRKSGPGVDFWKNINRLEPKLKYWKKYKSGVDFLNKNDLLSKNIIATHLSQATKEDLLILKEKNIKLVHCPRSNFYLNNGTANLKFWNELGFLWGIGTDSNASNKNLDLLEELRFAINQQKLVYNFSISAKDGFSAITSNAAKIISKDSYIGYLKSGYCADFLIFNIKEKSGCTYSDPYHLLIWDLNSNKDLKEVWINGQKAWLAKHVLHKI
ncbi:MAG: amidohydrolase family protein [Candidatus Melainabacteria bacterium]|nr:amidohydrolase family protein [Candidatus Melainabacteria bacterium]